ncbi:MAG: MBL fold metallo-hydrolase [Dehalobacter sp.]|nr:MBL fold metallo-hydrolase [Dehalobacter sp.]
MVELKCLASGSSGNAYYLTDGQTPLLLEAGISWKLIQQGLNFQTTSLAGCLVSHGHMDHCKAVKDVIKAGIDCYMSQETAQALGISNHRIKIVRALEQFYLGTWTILPFGTEHDTEGSLGFLIACKDGFKVLYLTDTAYCRYRFNGLSHILIEANYSLEILRENVANGAVPVELKNRLLQSHFSLENVKEFLKANDMQKVREIWLLHLSEGNSDAARFKREVQELTGKMVFVAK